jgi:hypothetical protein
VIRRRWTLLGRLIALVAALLLGGPPAIAGAQAAPGPAAAPVAGVPAPSGLVVPAGRTTAEDLVVVTGPVHVYGTVTGHVVNLLGDVTVHPGGHVTGDVVSLLGTARALGGRVDGDLASEASRRWGRARPDGPPRPPTVGESLKATVGWFGILLVIGFGILVAASRNLDGVAESLERGLGPALLAGLAGQVLVIRSCSCSSSGSRSRSWGCSPCRWRSSPSWRRRSGSARSASSPSAS